jgi:hypothetical protein
VQGVVVGLAQDPATVEGVLVQVAGGVQLAQGAVQIGAVAESESRTFLRTAAIGCQPVRDTELLAWCGEVIRSVLAGLPVA